MASKIDQQIAELNKAFDKVGGDVEELLADMVEDAAKATVKGAKRSMKKKTGAKDKRGRGTAPNIDTGELFNSIKYTFDRAKKEAFVYSDVFYGLILETVKNRPWLRPALKRVRRANKTRIRRQLRAAIKRAGKDD